MWRNLTSNQKAALGVATLMIVLTVVIVARTANVPRYVQLYGNLTATDASTVVEKLQEMKIDYRLAHGGNSIEVPSQHVDDARLRLAGEGLPRGGNVGFELFDKTQLGQSEFGERLNYVRALQGELERTIGQLRSVSSARVHLALPERRLYQVDRQHPTASVVLNLQGPDPSPGEIKAIVHLVASAVEGLEPANVTVIDTNNNLLSEMLDIAGGSAASARLQAQRAMATQMEQHVQSMLDRVLGPGKSIVRASVKLNYDQKTIEREFYSPMEDRAGIVESEHRTGESYGGDRRGASDGLAGVMASARGAAGGSDTRTAHAAQYGMSRSVEQIEVSPGQVERISLALFIDESVKVAELDTLKKTIATAVGIDIARGDLIEVQPMPFDTSAAVAGETAAEKQAQISRFFAIGKYAGSAVLLIVVLLAVASIVRAALGQPGAQSPAPAVKNAPVSAITELPVSQLPGLPTRQQASESEFIDVDPRRMAIVIRELMAKES